MIFACLIDYGPMIDGMARCQPYVLLIWAGVALAGSLRVLKSSLGGTTDQAPRRARCMRRAVASSSLR